MGELKGDEKGESEAFVFKRKIANSKIHKIRITRLINSPTNSFYGRKREAFWDDREHIHLHLHDNGLLRFLYRSILHLPLNSAGFVNFSHNLHSYLSIFQKKRNLARESCEEVKAKSKPKVKLKKQKIQPKTDFESVISTFRIFSIW